MEDSWWDGYEAGMTGEGDNPYPFGVRRALWELGKVSGCNILATVLEAAMKMEAAERDGSHK